MSHALNSTTCSLFSRLLIDRRWRKYLILRQVTAWCVRQIVKKAQVSHRGCHYLHCYFAFTSIRHQFKMRKGVRILSPGFAASHCLVCSPLKRGSQFIIANTTVRVYICLTDTYNCWSYGAVRRQSNSQSNGDALASTSRSSLAGVSIRR
jgi:hypothetical protein